MTFSSDPNADRCPVDMKVPIFDDAVIDLNAPAWKDRELHGCE